LNLLPNSGTPSLTVAKAIIPVIPMNVPVRGADGNMESRRPGGNDVNDTAAETAHPSFSCCIQVAPVVSKILSCVRNG